MTAQRRDRWQRVAALGLVLALISMLVVGLSWFVPFPPALVLGGCLVLLLSAVAVAASTAVTARRRGVGFGQALREATRDGFSWLLFIWP